MQTKTHGCLCIKARMTSLDLPKQVWSFVRLLNQHNDEEQGHVLTCLLLKVLCLTRVLNASMGHSSTQKLRTPRRHLGERLRTYNRACALLMGILNLHFEDTCVMQV